MNNMLSVIHQAARAVLFIFIILNSVSARSMHHVIRDSITKQLDATSAHTTESIDENVFNQEIHSRMRRQASNNNCQVHPDTAVIFNGTETYFPFDQNEPRPAFYPGEDEPMDCPDQGRPSWWPGDYDNFKAVCPWKWVSTKTWLYHKSGELDLEIYPKYIQEAKCLCNYSVNAKDLGCYRIKRKFQFYAKMDCQGNKPVFESQMIDVVVGCFSADKGVTLSH